MTDGTLDRLLEKAAKLLTTRASALQMLADMDARLATVRSELLAAGVKAGSSFTVAAGEVGLDEGPVTGRRAANEVWLEEHFESLPSEARKLIDTFELVTARMDGLDPVTALNLRNTPGVKVTPKRTWPKVADLERLLPCPMQEEAITKQVRGAPRLVLKDPDGFSTVEGEK